MHHCIVRINRRQKAVRQRPERRSIILHDGDIGGTFEPFPAILDVLLHDVDQYEGRNLSVDLLRMASVAASEFGGHPKVEVAEEAAKRPHGIAGTPKCAEPIRLFSALVVW